MPGLILPPGKRHSYGASFASSYANLFMGFWVELYILSNNPFIRHLVLFGRYIDDIPFLWQGDQGSIHKFLSYCNGNSSGIQFTSAINKDYLVFFDLELYQSDSGIL